jgi:uncharacterized delta-60 repeat protein
VTILTFLLVTLLPVVTATQTQTTQIALLQSDDNSRVAREGIAGIDTYWARTYGGNGDDTAWSVQQTSDGGYIVAGETYSFGAHLRDIWVLKLDPRGAVVWQKTYSLVSDDYARSVQQTSDGGYVVAGFIAAGLTGPLSGGYFDAWVLKLDPSGAVVWQKTYGGSSYDWAWSIQQTSDGGYIVGGNTESFGAGDIDAWVLKLDSNGSIVWQKTYGESEYDWASSVKATSDGGYVVAGDTYSLAQDNYDVRVLKINSAGSITWQNTYGGTGNDYAYSVQQTTDGGYVVAGHTDSFGEGFGDFWVVKLDSSGSVEWQKTYGQSGNYDWAYSVQQTSDEGYVVAGYTFPMSRWYIGSQYAGKPSSDFSGVDHTEVAKSNPVVRDIGNFLLLKLAHDGFVEWEKAYGGKGDSRAYSVQQTADEGYVVAGSTNSFGAGGWDDFWVVKLSDGGDIVWNRDSGASTNMTGYASTDSDAKVSKTSVNVAKGAGIVQDTQATTFDTNATVMVQAGSLVSGIVDTTVGMLIVMTGVGVVAAVVVIAIVANARVSRRRPR